MPELGAIFTGKRGAEMLLFYYKYYCTQQRAVMNFYTYAYLREDGTPYYIGKGKGRRYKNRSKNDIKPPRDKSRVIFLKQNLTEEEAFKHEIYMIAMFGRKDLETGILHNKTDGGDGCSGFNHREETKKKISKANKNPSKLTRQRISMARKNRPITDDTKLKISSSLMGNNFAKGNKIDRKIVDRLTEQKKKNKWWNNGVEQKFCPECPTGWESGRLTLKGNYSKPGDKNPKSKIWEITYSDGSKEIINCLAKWCEENNYITNTVRSAMKNKRPYKNILKITPLRRTYTNEIALFQ